MNSLLRKLDNEITRGGAGVILARGASGILLLIASVTWARLLGAAEFGRYSFAMSVVALIVVISQLGIPTLVVRETARAVSKREWEFVKGLWQWSHYLSIILSLFFCGAVLTTFIYSQPSWGSKSGGFAVHALCIPTALVLLNLRVSILRGLRLVVAALVAQKLVLALTTGVGGCIAFFFFFERHFTAENVLLLEVSGISIGFLIAFFYSRTVGSARTLKTDRISMNQKAWLAAALPLALVTGLRMINTNIDILTLGVFRSHEEVGIYRIAAKVATVSILGQEVVNMAVSPHFARLHAKGEFARLQRYAKRSAQFSFLIAVAVFGILFLFGQNILAFLFGVEFEHGYAALLILAFAHVISASLGSVGVLLNMTGHEKKTAKASLVATILNLLLNFTLIPFFGLIGASLATGASLILWNVLAWRSVRSFLGIDSSVTGSGHQAGD